MYKSLTLSIVFLFFNTFLSNSLDSVDISFKTITKNNIQYILIEDFVNHYELKYRFYDSKEKLEIQYGSKIIYFAPFSSYCRVNNKIYHMTYSTILKNNKIYVPVEPFYKILQKEKIPTELLSIKKNLATAVIKKYNLKKFNISKKKNGVSININTTKQFDSKNIALSVNSEGWVNLTVLGAHIDSLGMRQSTLIHPIKRVYTIQSEESAQISFLCNQEVDDFAVEVDKKNIKINLRTEHASNVEKIEKIREKRIIDTIVIDAGHGGKDPGAIGVNKLQEKTVVLDIAKNLGALIERNLGVKVVYTRKDDVFIPLWKRTQTANQAGGDLFLSIHANATKPHSKTRGFETYLLRVGKTDKAIEITKRENGVIALEKTDYKYQNLDDAQFIVASMSQNADMKNSEKLADLIQKKMANRLKQSVDRGVKQAGFHVLVGASMPNVLIEVGFLSNKNEANLLGRATYRREIAKAIYEAIADYKKEYESKQ